MPPVRRFDAQIRFVLTASLKRRLDREAIRRRMSTADLIRLLLEEGLARGFVKTEGRRPAPSKLGKLGSQGLKLTKAL
jgi:hypothetical protein